MPTATMLDPASVSPALYRRLCRDSFRAFLLRAWPHISGGEALAWNWHIGAIAYRLGQVERGKDLRLIVNLAPRSGKSKMISVIWIAWMLGRDPTRNFVCVSYSNELSAKLARDCLAIVQAPWYRAIFPDTAISAKRSAQHDFETTRGGGRLATSVGGTLTGRGGDIIVIDDPIKPEEALSETTRKAVNQWFTSTLATRLDDKSKGAIICVMQRLHQDDLSGMLLEQGGWRQLCLPAIATCDEAIPISPSQVHHRKEGELLHPARETRAILDDLKAKMGSVAFAAQYQQDPVPEAGNMAKADWLRSFDPATLVRRPGQIVQSWDTASKEGVQSDWSVCITAHVFNRQVRILDVFRQRVDFVKLCDAAIRLAQEHTPNVLLIEDAASGQQLLQWLRSPAGAGVPLPIPIRPEDDKVTRFGAACKPMEAGALYLPHEAAWLAAFKTEILAFPGGKHDDQSDALSQLLNWAISREWQASVDIGDDPCLSPTVFTGNESDEEFYNADDDPEAGPLY